MTGVYKALSDLLTEADSTLADNQAAASITPARVRQLEEDLVASLAPTETALTFSTSLAWNMATNPVAYVVLTGNTTITVSGGTSGQSYRIGLIQDATGNRTIALSGCTILGNPLWATAASGVNIVTIEVVNGTSYAAVA